MTPFAEGLNPMAIYMNWLGPDLSVIMIDSKGVLKAFRYASLME